MNAPGCNPGAAGHSRKTAPPSCADSAKPRSLRLLTGIGGNRNRGAAPGTPVFVGERRAEAVRITRFHYSNDQCREEELSRVEDLCPLAEDGGVTWVNVIGVHDVDIIQTIGNRLGLHPLVQEDIANTGQRPKFEDYQSHAYMVVRMLRFDTEARRILNEQVSLILGPGYVITFQEREGDVFEPLRERLRSAKGRVRTLGADYLFYALLDAVVDGYFEVLEGIGDYAEDVERVVMSNPQPETLGDIHDLRTKTAFLRKSVWPLREAVNGLDRSESELVNADTKVFVRDVYDHTVQLLDTVEALRDVAGSLFETHLTMVGNRMNEIMKVLTIIATIFIPITFVAGIYGMNFQHMPELAYRWGYPAVWALMLAVTATMLTYFKRKKWL